MPAIVGATQVVNVEGNAVVHFGDTAVISPKSNSKTTNGSGAVNTGALFMVTNGFSLNTTFDANLIDQPIAGNN
ncbi:spore germination protein [Heyndrickxia vini]|uniref:Spore germination protein n=1 Tax=Heyndrickxia vini TaxID=1476025 RepID=A0ABX7DYW9_9BACI|nr:spore germination protein [Heyndrickxia vini]QQZ08260.1 spore germination protein [Heyndrickxia vini]